METTIYADLLFLVNFSMDFITLWLSALLTSQRRSALRMSISAAVGAAFGILSVLFPLGRALTVLLAGGVSIIMCLIAFGFGGIICVVKQSAIIWGCGALLGGVMTAVLSIGSVSSPTYKTGGGILSVIAAAAVIAVYVTVRIICNSKGKKTVSVKARFKNKELSFTALCDSGNLMRDPLSGDPVIPVSIEIIEKLCGKKAAAALINMDTYALLGFGITVRIIPRKSESGSEICAGFIPDSLTVICGKQKKNARCILLPKDCKKDYFAGCAATVPSSLLP